MARNIHDPYADPFDAGQSPIIDPGQGINFDNLTGAPDTGAETAEEPGTGEKIKDPRSILERLRQARAESSGLEKPEPAKADAAPGQCPHCAEAEKARLLALADTENARKRLAREKEEFLKFAGESVMADILPALDNLDLALAYAPENKECRNFVIGVDMTRKLLLEALSKHGLEQVGALGEEFDPARHEAVAMEPSSEFVNGQVCALMNKGYRLKDRLIRPARVKVCKND